MSRSALPFILEGAAAKADLNPEHLDADRARIAARFWAGKYEGSSAKAACVERIAAVWRDHKRVEQILAALRPEERTVLGVVKRFGGSISGTLLQRELLARGVLRREDPDGPMRFGRNQLSHDPVLGLCERLVLIKAPAYFSYYSYGPLREYPEVSLPTQLARFVNPVPPLTWKVSRPSDDVTKATTVRAATQMLVDLAQTAQALEAQGTWKTNQGGGLPAGMRNRLAKLRPAVATDPFAPPDPCALDYSLLSTLRVIEYTDGVAWLNRERADHFLDQSLEVQTSAWVRAWLSLRLWQDGIGAVPERDSETDPTRINPGRLKQGRALLAWALMRIAHNQSDDWLDLETFLLDLHSAAGERGLDFYWHGFVWHPHLASAAGKDKLAGGPERLRAFWMDQEGVWAANALLSTLVHLGVVERTGSAGPRATHWSFRLTDIGNAVFGAPEVAFKKPAGSEKCLTVQPNHDVLLYLDAADGPAIKMLGRIASQESTAGLVQTFKLTRESVYGALEGGMAPGAMEAFLSSRSRSGLPANVSQSLAEWSRKREALVVRSEVAVELIPGGSQDRGRALGPGIFLSSPRLAHKEAKNLAVGPESKTPCRDWQVDEHGSISPTVSMSMSILGSARLRRFAESAEGTWRISARSVRAAKELGITADQILHWLTAHTSDSVPPVLAMAIRNWAGARAKAFYDNVMLLQVDDAKAFEALGQSVRLRPYIKGALAPGTFIVTEDGRKEVANLLRELGVSLDGECRLRPPDEVASNHGEMDHAVRLLKVGGAWPRRRR